MKQLNCGAANLSHGTVYNDQRNWLAEANLIAEERTQYEMDVAHTPMLPEMKRSRLPHDEIQIESL